MKHLLSCRLEAYRIPSESTESSDPLMLLDESWTHYPLDIHLRLQLLIGSAYMLGL